MQRHGQIKKSRSTPIFPNSHCHSPIQQNTPQKHPRVLRFGGVTEQWWVTHEFEPWMVAGPSLMAGCGCNLCPKEARNVVLQARRLGCRVTQLQASPLLLSQPPLLLSVLPGPSPPTSFPRQATLLPLWLLHLSCSWLSGGFFTSVP